MFITVGAFVLAISVWLFMINVAVSYWRGPKAPANPWGARTLEWTTTSPPPHGNYARTPIVTFNPYDFSKPAAWFGPPDQAPADQGGEPTPDAVHLQGSGARRAT